MNESEISMPIAFSSIPMFLFACLSVRLSVCLLAGQNGTGVNKQKTWTTSLLQSVHAPVRTQQVLCPPLLGTAATTGNTVHCTHRQQHLLTTVCLSGLLSCVFRCVVKQFCAGKDASSCLIAFCFTLFCCSWGVSFSVPLHLSIVYFCLLAITFEHSVLLLLLSLNFACYTILVSVCSLDKTTDSQVSSLHSLCLTICLLCSGWDCFHCRYPSLLSIIQ